MQPLCKCGKYTNPKREQWWCLECYKVYLAEKEKKFKFGKEHIYANVKAD